MDGNGDAALSTPPQPAAHEPQPPPPVPPLSSLHLRSSSALSSPDCRNPSPLAPIPIRPPPPANVDAGIDSDDSSGGTGGEGVDYEISELSRLARERHEKARQELLLKRRAHALAVPTNDGEMRRRLWRLGVPMTIFGEREMKRRDRLRRSW